MARRPVACRIARRFKPSPQPQPAVQAQQAAPQAAAPKPPCRPKRQRPAHQRLARALPAAHAAGQQPAPPTGHASRSSPPAPPGLSPAHQPPAVRMDARLAAAASMARFRRNALLFQEQIKGPENAPIARFDGLGCYRIGSENALVFSVRAAAGACWRRIGSGFLAAFWRLWGGWRAQGRAQAVLPPCGVWGPAPGPVRKLAGAPVLLQKQEQIKGPENAPIARFDGLGCYRIGSENALVFSVRAASKTGWAAGLAAGLAA